MRKILPWMIMPAWAAGIVFLLWPPFTTWDIVQRLDIALIVGLVLAFAGWFADRQFPNL